MLPAKDILLLYIHTYSCKISVWCLTLTLCICCFTRSFICLADDVLIKFWLLNYFPFRQRSGLSKQLSGCWPFCLFETVPYSQKYSPNSHRKPHANLMSVWYLFRNAKKFQKFWRYLFDEFSELLHAMKLLGQKYYVSLESLAIFRYYKLGKFVFRKKKQVLKSLDISKQTSDNLEKLERTSQGKFFGNFWLPGI